ncbi:MAG: ABC transporter permease [Candidatus Ozemobacteraceae bacterium]
MNFGSVLKLALTALRRNKLRSFLTALGIIIGVGSVITMVGLGLGAFSSIHDTISKLGTNMLMIIPGSDKQHGPMGSMQNLTEADAKAIAENCPSLTNVTPEVMASTRLVFRDRNWQTMVRGVTEKYLDIRSWPVLVGRNISAREARDGSKICVLGKTVVDNLFGSVSPIGKIIRVDSIPMEVIGVLESRGQTGMGQDQDDNILVPFSTLQKRMLGITYVHVVVASARSEAHIESGKDEIAMVLRQRHKISRLETDDFQIQTQSDLLSMVGATLGIITFLLGCIASVSLMVGGIGIMNIMLVSVTERTREIGIRMAVGARGRDILTQFLVEAMAISGVGGILGIGAGICLIYASSYVSGWPVEISLMSILVSFLFSAFVGVVFGLFPAWKASSLDPIDALRFE